VVQDDRMHWNYTHTMIRQAERLQEAINNWVFKTLGLQALLVNEDEWKTLGEIADILEVWVYSFIITNFSNLQLP
ncbi:hypothetical protein L208DRAFT_1244236, partial [Tricholoma matsutake]